MTTAFYTHPACQLHEMGAQHPESPARISTITDHLIRSGVDKLIEHRQAPLATEEQLAMVHSKDTIRYIKEHIPQSGYFSLDADTTLNPSSWTAALAAAGATLTATKAVLDKEIDNAFCCIRPPGHHAEPDRAMGFCLFNNIALAAKYALDQYGLQRVAIVDFDVHHGNGTQVAFENDPRVLMVSFFQHPFYPFSGSSSASENMLNLPVPANSDGKLIHSLIEQHWLPALHHHRPQMIFISAGFDAHREDLIGQLRLEESDYTWITAQIKQIAKQYCQGRMVSCLEGGYSLPALGRSAVAHIQALVE